MTTLGKALVIVTLVGSIVLLGASGAIYFSQQNLTPPEKGQPSAANLAQKQYQDASDRFKKADEALQRVRKNYANRMGDLEQVETAYYAQPEFYAKELSALQDSKDNINTVARQNGNVLMDDKVPGRVKMEPAKDALGQPVESAATYAKKIADQEAAMNTLMVKLVGDPNSDDPKTKAGLIHWQELLTLKLYEKLADPKADPAERGLRVDLATEKDKLSQLEKEVEYLDDTNSKFVVDNESLTRRHDQMIARKTELEKSLRERH